MQDNIDKVETARKELDLADDTEQEKYIEKISVIENSHAKQKSEVAWAIINEVSGRRQSNTQRMML